MKINKKVNVESLVKKTIKILYMYSSIEDSEVVLVFERNNSGLKKQTSDSTALYIECKVKLSLCLTN
jgi:hypothetical protein